MSNFHLSSTIVDEANKEYGKSWEAAPDGTETEKSSGKINFMKGVVFMTSLRLPILFAEWKESRTHLAGNGEYIVFNNDRALSKDSMHPDRFPNLEKLYTYWSNNVFKPTSN